MEGCRALRCCRHCMVPNDDMGSKVRLCVYQSQLTLYLLIYITFPCHFYSSSCSSWKTKLSCIHLKTISISASCLNARCDFFSSELEPCMPITATVNSN